MEFGKKKKMSPIEMKAKMSVLKDLNGQATDMMKDGLKGIKKVSVMSDSKKGLAAGLEKAEDMLGEESEDEEYGEMDSSKMEGYEDAQDESEPMDEDELDAKIQELMAMKEKLQK